MFPSPTPSPFAFSNVGGQQQQQQPQQFQMPGLVANTSSPQVHLVSNDRSPLSYQAKWTDINDESKNLLLAIEEKMMEYRDESRRLDQSQRLHDSPALQKGFELEATRISQELGGIGAAVVREQTSLADMVEGVKVFMRNAEIAVRSFMRLRSHFSARLQAPALTASGPATSAGGALSFSTQAPNAAATPPATTAGTLPDFYSGIPTKPSAFLLQTVARFELLFTEYKQRVEELDRLLQGNHRGHGENGSVTSELSSLQSLPTVMTNVHDFFIHVAAEAESLHQQVEGVRTQFIADRRRRGDDSNPFLEADRREVARQELAAKRVHPTLNVPSSPLQFQTQGIGGTPQSTVTFGVNSAQSSPFAAQSSTPLFATTGAANPLSTSSFGQFMPFGSSASQSPFAVRSASTPASNTPFFGAPTPGAPTQSSLFGATPSPSPGIFGASSGGALGASATGSLFGTPSPAPAFGTPGTSTPIFGVTTPAAGATTATPLFGMGTTNPNAAAQAAKARPRGPRRK